VVAYVRVWTFLSWMTECMCEMNMRGWAVEWTIMAFSDRWDLSAMIFFV
jgi:hypothetical protein